MAENGARRIRLGMVGGGTGAFIGYVHRIASRLDGDYELVAGALSSRPEVARESGKNIGLAPDRIYTSYEEMANKEAARPDGIEAVRQASTAAAGRAPAEMAQDEAYWGLIQQQFAIDRSIVNLNTGNHCSHPRVVVNR